jgi:hypothetical protein
MSRGREKQEVSLPLCNEKGRKRAMSKRRERSHALLELQPPLRPIQIIHTPFLLSIPSSSFGSPSHLSRFDSGKFLGLFDGAGVALDGVEVEGLFEEVVALLNREERG